VALAVIATQWNSIGKVALLLCLQAAAARRPARSTVALRQRRR
jgi:hypothetical protein